MVIKKKMTEKEFDKLRKEVGEKAKKYKNEPVSVCRNCGEGMYAVWDKTAKKYTGYSWWCECMPLGMTMCYMDK